MVLCFTVKILGHFEFILCMVKGVKVESEKVGLKLNIQKMKIMASGPITSWEIDGETVSDFIFLGSWITADGDCSHEIKRRLLLGRKVMTNLEKIRIQKDACTPMFLEILLTISKTWKESKCSLTEEWMSFPVLYSRTLLFIDSKCTSLLVIMY